MGKTVTGIAKHEAGGTIAHPAGSQVFHPVPFYFKMGELGRDQHGDCRREGTDGCVGVDPGSGATITPQSIYPQCIWAAHAGLFGAYRLLLPSDVRQWHAGTPAESDPISDPDGDHFSTAAIGLDGLLAGERSDPLHVHAWPTDVDAWPAAVAPDINETGFDYPKATIDWLDDYAAGLNTGVLTEDFRNEFARATGDVLSMDEELTIEHHEWNELHSWAIVDRGSGARYNADKRHIGDHLVLHIYDPAEIETRAARIRECLEREVGGWEPGAVAKPVYIAHPGHSWLIVGVDRLGYWSHGQNPESEGLSDWSTWDNAPWIGHELEKRLEPYTIRFPRCRLKPESKRLGSLGIWVFAGGRGSHAVQFVDLPNGKTIDWTPHRGVVSGRRTPNAAGYLWITSDERLDLYGYPLLPPDDWDDQWGARIPIPANRSTACTCRGRPGAAADAEHASI